MSLHHASANRHFLTPYQTRNPDKYNKNADRNRFRDIEGERRRIWSEAVKQAQRLAAVHDPSGVTFNVGPVTTQDDGTVVSLVALKKREERAATKQSGAITGEDSAADKGNATEPPTDGIVSLAAPSGSQALLHNAINPDRLAQINLSNSLQPPKTISKTHQKRLEALAPRPGPPKPMIPAYIQLPEGEEDWLALWDLSDEQLEKRVMREKKRKAAERKALRVKQQEGKAERRAARDEKRRVYREIKVTWKAIKGRLVGFEGILWVTDVPYAEEEKQYKRKLLTVEQEEIKRIAMEVNVAERKAALEQCAELGFDLTNTPGVDEIKPRAMGMKGIEVDFDKIQTRDGALNSKIQSRSRRIDLGGVADDSKTQLIPIGHHGRGEDTGDFIEFDAGHDQDYEVGGYNHRVRRKLRRAVEAADIKKEMLVRQIALKHCHENGIEPPGELQTSAKPINIRGQAILVDGTLETAKQERVRMRMELAEYNKAARVLRKQAKQAATEAGLRKFAEMTGAISKDAGGASYLEHTASILGEDSTSSSSDELEEMNQNSRSKHSCGSDNDDTERSKINMKRCKIEGS